LAVNEKSTSDRLELTFPFSAEVMKAYESDGLTEDDALAQPDKYPLRVAVIRTVQMLNRHARGEVMIGNTKKKVRPLEVELRGAVTDQVKRRFLNEQREGPAAMSLELMEHLESMEKLAADRKKESSPRWQAHFDYVLAQLKLRFAYVNEYNLMLGKIRKDELPPLDPKIHKGWRLAAQEKMQSPREIRDLADDAKKILTK